MDILDILASDNYIVFNKTLAKEIGLENAIVFGALCGYQKGFKNEEFYREQYKIMEDTCLTEYAIRKSMKELKQLKLVEIIKKGIPAKYYFKINTTRLIEMLTTSGCENDTTGGCEIDTTIINNNNKNNNKNNKKEKTIKEMLEEQDPELEPVFENFIEMRKKIKKPLTDYAFKLLLNKLEKLSGGFNGNKLLILNQSIVNCWQDIYELKGVKFSDFKQELVEYAKELAKDKGDNYIMAILNNWKSQNITTLEEAKLNNDLFIKGVGNQNNDKFVIHDRKYSQEDYNGLVCDIDDIEI